MDQVSDTFSHQNNSGSQDDDFSEFSDDARNTDRFSSFSEEDSGIVYDLEDETVGGISSADEEIRAVHIYEQNLRGAANRFHASRRHSLGDSNSAAVRPSPQRRCSFQMLSTIHWENGIQENDLFGANEAICGSQSSIGGMGSQLFLAFLQEEISRSHLQAPGCLYDTSRASSRRESLQAEEFVNIGRHLRNVADEFAISDQRQRVRERAENVPLQDLDATTFTDLLIGMFQQGGITYERVLVLFVFCADLALRVLREHLLALFVDVTRWSQQYIESWVSPLVQRHGGWSVVFERTVHEVYKAAVIGACVMSMVALWTFIRTAGR